MAEVKRMPSLTMDEVILLVDTYFQIKDITAPSVKKERIQELSDSMHALPFFPEFKESQAFRSYSGMNMCLSKVASVDPFKISSFGRGSTRQRKVFEYYSSRKATLHSIANTIKVIGRLDFPILPTYEDNIMGMLLPSYYEYLEQSDRTVKNARKVVLAQGKTKCSLCGCDLEEVYLGRANELLEAHIALPIRQISRREKITLSDILFLCPTCHKLAHTAPELIEEQNLRELVKGR